MMQKGQRKVYTLDDGTKITAPELAEKLGIRLGLAANRLSRSSDPDRVFSGYGEYKFQGKKYTLDDGQVVTAKDVCEITGLSENRARGRLAKSRDPEYVLKPKAKGIGCKLGTKRNKIPKILEDRMAFNDRDHWVLIMKNT